MAPLLSPPLRSPAHGSRFIEHLDTPLPTVYHLFHPVPPRAFPRARCAHPSSPALLDLAVLPMLSPLERLQKRLAEHWEENRGEEGYRTLPYGEEEWPVERDEGSSDEEDPMVRKVVEPKEKYRGFSSSPRPRPSTSHTPAHSRPRIKNTPFPPLSPTISPALSQSSSAPSSTHSFATSFAFSRRCSSSSLETVLTSSSLAEREGKTGAWW
ncbi:hypothetical protein JCM10207_002472 [Rhodosporidiobolus poonsookiae]